MAFCDVKGTGESWHARFFVRDPDADGTNGYTRMFLLEHSEYTTELADDTPSAMVCENQHAARTATRARPLRPPTKPASSTS
jgi:hypothetical protein